MGSSQDDQTMSVLEEAERLKISCKHEESIVLLEGLLSSDPGNVAALEELADNELSMERYDRAVTAAKQAIALDNKSYMGHYILGVVASLNEDWPASHEELQLANSIRPNNPEILRCLGWVLYNSEKRVQGVVTLERSLNLDPENTLTLSDLGVCYFQMRNFTKARSLFEQVVNLDPENSRAKECLDMICSMHADSSKRPQDARVSKISEDAA
jgi:Tfp pilus assembly protein PilF